MGITLHKPQLQASLEKAVRIADRGDLPQEWIERTEHIGECPSKTYVAVLASALLARATYGDELDPHSIKRRSGPRGFSARGSIAVLAGNARDFGYDLGVSGPEPLNNQPWFHVERVDEIRSEAVRADTRDYLRAIKKYLKDIDQLDCDAALRALGALIATRRLVAKERQATARELLTDRGISLAALGEKLTSFITDDPERGKRGQALVAAALDCVFPRVELGGIHDPDAFDVVAYGARQDEIPSLAVQVKQKAVEADAALRLAEAASNEGIPSALLVAIAPDQSALNEHALANDGRGLGVTLIASTSAIRLLEALATFSTTSPVQIGERLPETLRRRLREIEVRASSIDELEAVLGELEDS